jgi:membrane protease YdiL (CAAX protease family)
MSNIEIEEWSESQRLSVLARHPVAVLLGVSIPVVLATQAASLLAGVDVMPAKIAELVLLLSLACWITSRVGGRGAVRQLFAGLTRWRLGRRYPLLLLAMPLSTIGVALVTGTVKAPDGGWGSVALTYVVLLLLGAVTGNLWEETVWGGFVQGRLMAARGLLVGALLTAIPFFVIHLPLAFEVDGLKGTSWQEACLDWALIGLAAPFQRYLIGTLLVDTGGSTLAAGLMHASINAAGAMAVTRGGWQFVPALIVVTVVVAAYRRRQGLSAVDGYAPSLDGVPGPERVVTPVPAA